MHQIGVLLFRTTSKGWRNGPKVLKINSVERLHADHGEEPPKHKCMPHLESSLARNVLGVPVHTKLDTSLQFAFAAKKAKGTWAALGKSADSRSRDVILFLCSGKRNLKCWVQHWAAVGERCEHCGVSPRKGLKDGSIWHNRRG